MGWASVEMTGLCDPLRPVHPHRKEQMPLFFLHLVYPLGYSQLLDEAVERYSNRFSPVVVVVVLAVIVNLWMMWLLRGRDP